jgi:hypothetical protein
MITYQDPLRGFGQHRTKQDSDFFYNKTSMVTDEGPLRRLLFYKDLGFSHTLHVLEERTRMFEHPHRQGKGSPVPAGPPIFDDADTRAGGPRRGRSPDS